MVRLKFILSHRWLGFILTLLSIVAINSWQQVLENFGWDNSFSLAAAKNISEGHGYSITMASPADYSKIYYEPLNKWPPGYSWLLLLIRKMTSADWIHSAYLLNGIALTALVLIFRKMLFQLEFPVWIINVSVFCFGFIPHGFDTYYYSDIVALLLFMSGCSLLLQYVKSEKNGGIRVLIATACFGYVVWLKYLYVLVSFIPLIILIGYARNCKRIQMNKWGLRGILGLSLLVGSLFIYQNNHAGNAVFIHQSKTGFFPEQLLRVAPIVPAGFVNMNFYDLQISKYLRIPVQTLELIWKVINIVCLIWLGYQVFVLLKSNFLSKRNYRSFYVLLAIGITSAIFIFLAILTVRMSKNYPDLPFPWVYFEEIRYYAPVVFLLQQFAIYLFIKPEFFFSGKTAFVYRILLIVILLEEISHGCYFMTKQILMKKQYGMQVSTEQPYLKALQITQREMLKGDPVIICSTSPEYTNICSLAGASALNDFRSLQIDMPSSKHIRFLIVTNRKEQAGIQEFVSKTNSKLEYQCNGISYYITDFPKTINNKNLPDHTGVQ